MQQCWQQAYCKDCGHLLVFGRHSEHIHRLPFNMCRDNRRSQKCESISITSIMKEWWVFNRHQQTYTVNLDVQFCDAYLHVIRSCFWMMHGSRTSHHALKTSNSYSFSSNDWNEMTRSDTEMIFRIYQYVVVSAISYDVTTFPSYSPQLYPMNKVFVFWSDAQSMIVDSNCVSFYVFVYRCH